MTACSAELAIQYPLLSMNHSTKTLYGLPQIEKGTFLFKELRADG